MIISLSFGSTDSLFVTFRYGTQIPVGDEDDYFEACVLY
jgi:hypothetical protein